MSVLQVTNSLCNSGVLARDGLAPSFTPNQTTTTTSLRSTSLDAASPR